MGIGIVLLFWLIFGLVMLIAAAIGIFLARSLRHRRWRLGVRLALGLFAGICFVPFAGTLHLLLFPRLHPNPSSALDAIFERPFPSGVKALNATGDGSSDYRSLYVEVQVDRVDFEFLRASRALLPLTTPSDQNFQLPTNVESPDFWPGSCEHLEVYERNSRADDPLPSPGTWDQIRMLYCPAIGLAYVWAVDVE